MLKKLIVEVKKTETPPEAQKFMDTLKKDFHKHFPNGFIDITYDTTFSTSSFTCTFDMVGNPKDNAHGITSNQIMKHGFYMTEIEGTDQWKFVVSSSWVYIKPSPDSRNTMDRIKTKMGNNSKITLDKTNAKMAKFFKKLSGIMQDNIMNIYGVENIKPKYLVFK